MSQIAWDTDWVMLPPYVVEPEKPEETNRHRETWIHVRHMRSALSDRQAPGPVLWASLEDGSIWESPNGGADWVRLRLTWNLLPLNGEWYERIEK